MLKVILQLRRHRLGMTSDFQHLSFYAARLNFDPSQVSDTGEVGTNCPFHQDSSASFSVNVQTGLFLCHAAHCGKKGNRKMFESLLANPTDAAVAGGPALDESLVNAYHRVLLRSETIMSYLTTNKGLTKETIEKYKLGFDAERILIPIYDEDGKLVNIRRYDRNAQGHKKMMNITGHGEVRLFPLPTNEASDWILLVEGEWDCFLAQQYGYPAMTTTGGSGSWKREFLPQFVKKNLVVCYDNDAAGIAGATKIASSLLAVAKSVKVLQLPFEEPKGADFSDFFLFHKNTKDDFDKLIQETPFFSPQGPSRRVIDEEVLDAQLADSGHEQYAYRRLQISLHIAGKDLAPFMVPGLIKGTCEMGRPECKFCGLAAVGGQLDFRFDETTPEVLEFIGAQKHQVDQIIRRAAGIVARCPKPTIEVPEHLNIEAVRVIPDLDETIDDEDERYTLRPVFFLGHGLELNQAYTIKGLALPDPRNQSTTILIYEAKLKQDSIDLYKPVPKTLPDRQVFEVEAKV